MPHLIIAYAAPLERDVDIQKLVDATFKGASESGLFNTADIKVRATPFAAYSTGGNQQAFVHVEIKLLPGRAPAQKKDLAQRVFDKVTACAPQGVALSVEINDLDGDSYTKRV